MYFSWKFYRPWLKTLHIHTHIYLILLSWKYCLENSINIILNVKRVLYEFFFSMYVHSAMSSHSMHAYTTHTYTRCMTVGRNDPPTALKATYIFLIFLYHIILLYKTWRCNSTSRTVAAASHKVNYVTYPMTVHVKYVDRNLV